MSIYLGGETTRAEKVAEQQSFLDKWKRHGKKTGKALAGRETVGTVMDIFKKFSPTAGHIAEPFVEWGAQKAMPLPEWDDKGGFWTSDLAKETKSQATEIEEGADATLLDHILGKGLEFFGSDEKDGSFNYDKFFSKEGTGGEISESGGLFSLLGFKQGGQVPKYENGGEVNLGDIISALSAKGVTYRGRSNKIEHADSGGYEVSGRYEVDTPEGTRFYEGKGSSKGMQLSMDKALLNALSTALGSPSDSLVTQAPKKYYGGGSVSVNPTISDYFSMQGKTPGGNNTQSIGEMLKGR